MEIVLVLDLECHHFFVSTSFLAGRAIYMSCVYYNIRWYQEGVVYHSDGK